MRVFSAIFYSDKDLFVFNSPFTYLEYLVTLKGINEANSLTKS